MRRRHWHLVWAAYRIYMRPMASLTTVEGPNVMNVFTTQPFTLKGHVKVDGVTDVEPGISGQAPNIEFWIGTSTTNTDPSGWSSWTLATYNPAVIADYDEYTIQKTLPTAQTVYFASRARINGASSPYTYGGVSATQVGGIWDGATYTNGTVVATVDVPSNDNFANAIPISCGASVTGNTTNASNDQPNPAVFGVNSQLTQNVWYSYNGGGVPKLVTVSLCNSSYDTSLLIATGTAGNLTYIAGGDNNCGTNGNRSTATFNSDGVTTYWIMVRGGNQFVYGAYVLDLSCAAPCTPAMTNDDCATAQPLVNGVITSTDNYCSTPSINPYPNCSSSLVPYYDSWYSFNTGSGTSVYVALTQSAPTVVGYAIYSGTCGSLTQKNCSDLGTSAIYTGFTANTVYYIRVFSESTAERGAFSLMVSPQTCTLTTTWNGAAWNNGTPSATKAAIIAGNYNATADLIACTLTVNNNAQVTVNSGFDFSVPGMVTVAPGASLTFENNANLLQAANTLVNYNSGNITVKRNANMRRLDYVYWGSPVAGQDLKLFSPYTVSPTNAPEFPTAPGSSRFYTLDEPTNSFVSITEPLGTSFAPPKGYMLRAPNNFPSNGTVATFNGVFNGVPNNGTMTIPVTYTNAGKGFNMLSNPYPSAMSASLFLAQNPGALSFLDAHQPGCGFRSELCNLYNIRNSFGCRRCYADERDCSRAGLPVKNNRFGNCNIRQFDAYR
ncbi:hypothetical protein [Flavobacterium sp. 3HN19-14]|uniref:hypothetical protein n=1 Tax=Flavobacterium sp. 3HN19-14 TaxID=3448133 RepID=UPI003EDFB760